MKPILLYAITGIKLLLFSITVVKISDTASELLTFQQSGNSYLLLHSPLWIAASEVRSLSVPSLLHMRNMYEENAYIPKVDVQPAVKERVDSGGADGKRLEQQVDELEVRSAQRVEIELGEESAVSGGHCSHEVVLVIPLWSWGSVLVVAGWSGWSRNRPGNPGVSPIGRGVVMLVAEWSRCGVLGAIPVVPAVSG